MALDRQSRTSAALRTYQRLKQDILTCVLPPGAVLSEGRLGEALEISKTPVREALAMLVHEGFVIVESRRGYRVKDITLTDVQEIFYLRVLLEPGAAGLAAQHATPEALRELQARTEDAIDAIPFGTADRAFHAALADASGNRRLAGILRRLMEEVYRLHMAGFAVEAPAEGRLHRELLVAILRGNHHQAHDIAERRVELDRELVMEALLKVLSSGATPALNVRISPMS